MNKKRKNQEKPHSRELKRKKEKLASKPWILKAQIRLPNHLKRIINNYLKTDSPQKDKYKSLTQLINFKHYLIAKNDLSVLLLYNLPFYNYN